MRLLVLFLTALFLGAVAILLSPPSLWPEGFRSFYHATFGEFAYRAPPPSLASSTDEPEAPCDGHDASWRKSQTIDGVEIEASLACNPDNPAAVASFVRGTNNVSHMTLMETQLAPDAVIKDNDRDGDGDPDEIHIRLEVVELNGGSPDHNQLVPAYAIAPGVQPGFWVFAPKTRGMATDNLEDLIANRLLRVPSPVIRIEKGDDVHITLENTHYMPHTIHFHGVDHPYIDANGEGNDGVPQTSEKPVMPGESRTYDMSPRQTGSMFYHCHVQPDVHILMGLQGMFVIEDARANNWVQTLNVGAGQVRQRSVASHQSYDREYDLHYQDIDRELHELIQVSNDPRLIIKDAHRAYDVTERTADYFMLNGRSFPYTFRESLVVVRPNEDVKLRVANGAAEGIALHTHGHKVTITHYDGVEHNPAAQITRDVVSISPAQRVDLLLDTTDDGLHSYGEGVWLMHDHREVGITTDGISPGGNVAAIVYESFLDENAWPRTQGVDWSSFFTPEYYARQLPVWLSYDLRGVLGDTAAGPLLTVRIILFAIAIGLLVGVIILILRDVRTRSGQ